MTKLSLITTAVFLACLGAAYAGDSSQSQTGAGIGTPGAENKGNPITVPDKASSSENGDNAVETTPGEENKGKPAIHE